MACPNPARSLALAGSIIACSVGLVSLMSGCTGPEKTRVVYRPASDASGDRTQADTPSRRPTESALQTGGLPHASAVAGSTSRDRSRDRSRGRNTGLPNTWASSAELGLNPERFRDNPRSIPAGREPIPESVNVTQVTFAHEGAAFDPVVSKGGEMVVFASTQHRPTADIYVQRRGSRVVTQLTNDPGHDAMPAISPDGSRIAFCSNRSGSWDIYVMDIDGGRALQITSDDAHEVHPSWSPDGRNLVFSRLGMTSGRWELWVTSANDASVSHFIGYGLFPEWCPEAGTGREGTDQIVFQRSRERGDNAFGIWTLDYRDGTASNPTEIVSVANAAVITPTWSPDGRRLIYGMVPNDGSWGDGDKPRQANLYMIDIDGTNSVRLTEGRTLDLMPAWADGNTVIFASDRGGVENLWSFRVSEAVALAEGITTQSAPVEVEPATPRAPVSRFANVPDGDGDE